MTIRKCRKCGYETKDSTQYNADIEMDAHVFEGCGPDTMTFISYITGQYKGEEDWRVLRETRVYDQSAPMIPMTTFDVLHTGLSHEYAEMLAREYGRKGKESSVVEAVAYNLRILGGATFQNEPITDAFHPLLNPSIY